MHISACGVYKSSPASSYDTEGHAMHNVTPALAFLPPPATAGQVISTLLSIFPIYISVCGVQLLPRSHVAEGHNISPGLFGQLDELAVELGFV